MHAGRGNIRRQRGTQGKSRWHLPRRTGWLPPELTDWAGAHGDSRWGELRAGEGTLALTLALDVWREDEDLWRVVLVGESDATSL